MRAILIQLLHATAHQIHRIGWWCIRHGRYRFACVCADVALSHINAAARLIEGR